MLSFATPITALTSPDFMTNPTKMAIYLLNLSPILYSVRYLFASTKTLTIISNGLTRIQTAEKSMQLIVPELLLEQSYHFFFGINAILTIVHAFTKYSERLKECPFSIIPTKGAGFQLFLSSLASIFYWGGDQRSIVGDCVLIYGCVDQLLLWTGQNIGVKLHDPSYVNDWEFGIQKGLMNCKGQQIPQNVLANAWVQGSKWGVKKPLFAFAQIFLFLNFVSSITLCPYFNNTDEIGISNNTLGNLLIIVDIMCWVFIVFGVFVSTFAYDAAQGPVLSMNVLTRIAVVAVFAGLDTFELSTKMALNFGSIVALIGGFVVPWEKMFESVTTCLAKKKKKE